MPPILTFCPGPSHTSHTRLDYDLLMTREEFLVTHADAMLLEMEIETFGTEEWTVRKVFDLAGCYVDGKELRVDLTRLVLERLVETL